MFLILLILGKALQADGPEEPIISSMEELLASPSHCFVGVVDIPMFQSGEKPTGPSVSGSCNLLQAHIRAVVLPYATFHWIMHDFGMQMQLLFGSSTEQELLHPSYEVYVLNHHYTGGIDMFDLAAIQTMHMCIMQTLDFSHEVTCTLCPSAQSGVK